MMSSRYNSSRRIKQASFGKYRVSDQRLQSPFGNQIHTPADHLGQFQHESCIVDKIHARVRKEFHQDVHFSGFMSSRAADPKSKSSFTWYFRHSSANLTLSTSALPMRRNCPIAVLCVKLARHQTILRFANSRLRSRSSICCLFSAASYSGTFPSEMIILVISGCPCCFTSARNRAKS